VEVQKSLCLTATLLLLILHLVGRLQTLELFVKVRTTVAHYFRILLDNFMLHTLTVQISQSQLSIVLMVRSGWWEVEIQEKAGWKSVFIMSGEPSVVMGGAQLMQMLHVPNWDITPQVWMKFYLLTSL